MTIFITGGAGFIGSHLVKHLAPQHHLKVLLLPTEMPSFPVTSHITLIRGDIRDGELLKKAMTGVHTVFHTAALVSDWGRRKDFWDINVGGMKNMLEAALEHQISRFITLSTNDVFGLKEGVTLDETFPLTSWGEPYSDSKIEAEKLLWHYHQQYSLPVSLVYPCWVYGPGDKTFLPLLADAILKKNMIFWRKEALVWPTYIDNLIDLLVRVSQHPRAVGHGFLVHDGASIPLQQLCAWIADYFKVSHPGIRIPYVLAHLLALGGEALWRVLRIPKRPTLTTYAVKNLGSRLQFSIEKSKMRLEWAPPVPFEEGIKRSLHWLNTLDRKQWKSK